MDKTIQSLYDTIQSRKKADVNTSYTSSLFAKGVNKITQKVGEEAVEVCIESISGNKEKIAQESADLIYHLLVLWAHHDITPEDVMNVLQTREGISGIDEKNNRLK